MPILIQHPRPTHYQLTITGALSDADLDHLTQTIDAAIARDIPCTVRCELRDARLPTPAQTAKLKAWFRLRRRAFFRLCTAQALIIPGFLLRKTAQSVLNRYRPPFAHTICATRADADAWLAAR